MTCISHGSHGPGKLLEKLLGPWKLLEFLGAVLEFYEKSLNTWDYSKISLFWHQKIKKIVLQSAEKRFWSLKIAKALYQDNSVFLVQNI